MPTTPTSAASPRPPRPPRSARLARLALVLGGLAAGLLLVELGLRLAAPAGAAAVAQPLVAAYPGHFFRTSGGLKLLRPDAEAEFRTTEYRTRVRSNALGLRGEALSPPPPGGQRLLVLGDSFTMAAQVPEEQTFVAQLEAGLSVATGRPVQAVNAGIDGHGTADSLRLLERLGPRLRPDAVLLALYWGNDLWDNARAAEGGTVRNVASGGLLGGPLRGPLMALSRRSFLLSHLVAWQVSRRGPDDPTLALHRNELAALVDPAARAAQLPHTERLLRALGERCEAEDLPCAVALLPPAHAVHTERLGPTVRLAGASPEEADLDGLVGAIRAAVPEGLAVVDLRPALLAAAEEGQRLYFVFDPHWTAAGHAVAATALAEALLPELSEPR